MLRVRQSIDWKEPASLMFIIPSAVAQESFSCIRTVITFASEQQEYEKYKERVDHQYKLNVRQVGVIFGMNVDEEKQ